MPSRVVHCEDGVAFIRRAPLGPGHAVITSLPDSSEVPKLGFEGWKAWFVDAVAACVEAVESDGVAVFFQTDVKRDGRWVDKGFLVQLGAERARAHQLFHKVVCRASPGITTFGRPAWAHLLAFSRDRRLLPGKSTPDVLPRLGEMPWARAMGVEACVAACRFVKAQGAHTVVDPFCGLGTALAVANRLGLDAIGVELSAKRASKARELVVHLDLPRGSAPEA